MTEGSVRPADNPFASRRIDGLDFRLNDREWKVLIDDLEARGGRGAVIGTHGSGKTTLLEGLACRLAGNVVWVRLNAESDRPAVTVLEALNNEIGPGHTVLIDGAEQLAPWSWWRIRRRLRAAGTIVITSHRPGRLPTLYECATDPELLKDLVAELAPEVVETVDLEALFHRQQGNIRSCLRELYDRYAGTGTGKVPEFGSIPSACPPTSGSCWHPRRGQYRGPSPRSRSRHRGHP